MSWSIYITRRIPQKAIDLLTAEEFKVEVYDHEKSIPVKTLQEKVKQCDALIPLLTDLISKDILKLAKNLKIIANFAVGYNNIDVEYATKKNIIVTNTPGVLTECTADLTFALMLALAKRIVEGDQITRRGLFKGWAPLFLLGAEITGKTLGIIGAGRIGSAVAQRAKGFDMQILYVDAQRNTMIEEKLEAKRADLDQLFEESDFITLHVPLTPATHHLVNRERLKQMKSSAFIINTSRGAVVDEHALVDALRKRLIAGAGLDVYENEPELTPGLAALENVVILPHIGSATFETRTKMAVIAAENIIALSKGVQPPNIINPGILT
jgi:D-3-phosphoglycerate dehydrogenase